MTDKLEQRMHEAFDRIHVPAGLAERTLARIEVERQAEAADGTAGKPSSVAKEPLSVVDGGLGRRGGLIRRRGPLVAVLAACLVLAALGIGGAAWAWQPYAYVAIDVNPSLELGINRFDRVSSTRSFNDDGAQVLEAADVDGQPYEQAMAAIEDALQKYLDDASAIEITIVCDDDAAASQLEDVGTRCLDASGAGQVHCSHASEADHHAAADADMGVGKYRVYQELVDAGVDISADEAQDMTMRELLDLAAENDVSIPWHAEHEEAHHGEGAASTGISAATGAEHHRTQNGQHSGRHHE